MSKYIERIEELKNERGYSWDTLAIKAGLKPAYLKKLRYEGRRINEDIIEALAVALGVPDFQLLAPKDIALGQVPVWEGEVPAGSPECLQEPSNVDKFVHGQVRNSQCFAKRIKDGSNSMNRVALPGQFILVDPTVTDPDSLNGKCVLAYYNGECTFKRFHKDPLRLAPDSTSPDYNVIFIPDFSDFRIVGWVYGTAGEL